MVVNLSERLRRIANAVPAGARLVDVGTDHALLPISLVQSGTISFAVATDIAEGPYRAAVQNVRAYHLQGAISVRLGSGLLTVEPGEVDVVVIAGMGGGTAVEVLQAQPEVVRLAARIIIQPMNASGQARRYLYEAGCGLVHESVFYDGERLYELIVAETGRSSADDYRAYTEEVSRSLAFEFGPLCLRKPTQEVVDLVRGARDKWLQIARSMEKSDSKEAADRRAVVINRVEWINQWLQDHVQRV